jgi:hypothetical protein
MLSSGAGAAILATALALVLTACAIHDPYATTRRSSSTVTSSSHSAGVPADDGPSPPDVNGTPVAAASSPQAALAHYAVLYVNWTAATLTADQRMLASLSTGQARAQALAEGMHPSPTVARYAVSNSGLVVAIAEGRGIERGRWAVVTDERTNGYGPYQGLPATSHVTWATVARVAGGGWVVSGWYPGS